MLPVTTPVVAPLRKLIRTGGAFGVGVDAGAVVGGIGDASAGGLGGTGVMARIVAAMIVVMTTGDVDTACCPEQASKRPRISA